jgi:purine-binding chemotaxis protein CheW
MHALLFTVDRLRCAIPLSRVAEVLPAVRIQPLPAAPAGVEGIVNVRGTIVPVVALHERLGATGREVRPGDYFILATASRQIILRSDDFPEIAEVSPSDAKRDEPVERALGAVVALPDGLVLLQDLDALITPDHDAEIRAALARLGAAA